MIYVHTWAAPQMCRSRQLLYAGAAELKIRRDSSSKFVSDSFRCSCLCYFQHSNVRTCMPAIFHFPNSTRKRCVCFLDTVLLSSQRSSGYEAISCKYHFSLLLNPVLVVLECRTSANPKLVFAREFNVYHRIRT
jgi:hypothetical protein